jgi:signal transduction histidine kinase
MRAVQARLLRPPLRLRITLASSASIALILVTLSLFVYVRLHAQLIQALDAGLQARASAIASGLSQTSRLGSAVSDGPDMRLATVTQIMTPGGRILASSGTTFGGLPARDLRALDGPAFFEVHEPGWASPLRAYVLPVNEGRPLVIVVASALTDLTHAMGELSLLLVIGDAAALALASTVAWLATGAALRPMERMRQEAAAYSVSDLARRLGVPKTNDEVARLGITLNSLLDRLQAALDRERRLLDDASHELRTPLSTLKTEIDLALSRARSPDELQAALQSAAEETNRLVRLAQDLLVLSRARDGGLRVHRVRTALGELVGRVCARHEPRAAQSGCRIECTGPATDVSADPMRLTQALDNLLDNAIRYSARGGLIQVCAVAGDGTATITVSNCGPGFRPDILPRAFEPFVSASPSHLPGRHQHGELIPDERGAGLGLAIVHAVAQAHGGGVTARNTPAGASVTMTLGPDP